MAVEQRPDASATVARRTRRRTRPLLVTGISLILVGVSLLGWLGWEFWGTNWLSHRTQARVIATLHHDWANGTTDTSVSIPGSDVPVQALAVVRIPRFGPDYAVPVLQGTSAAVLAAGFGHYPSTARPGQVGNFALAGHRVTHGEPLRNMPDLQVGDRVLVETRRRVFTYILDTGGEALVVPFTATWVLDPVPTNPDGGVEPPSRVAGQRLITLTTCSELFHTDNRLVAFGHLVSSRPSSRSDQPSG
ncbi:MAG: class E sortase [Nocardioides sp.]|nr:class E sortase [Nocardioides sp.]